MPESTINFSTLDYPLSSSFLKWLFPQLQQYNIPFDNYPTDGDYFQFDIGPLIDPFILNSKHLSKKEIECVSEAVEKYGYKILVQKSKDLAVAFVKN